MRALRLPLYGQFLAWLTLNLVLLALLLVAFAGREGLGLEMLLTTPARERVQAVGNELSRRLAQEPRASWPQTLAQYTAQYGLDFAVKHEERPRRAGDPGAGYGPGAGFGPAPGQGFGGRPPTDRPPPPEGWPRPVRRPPPDGAFVRLQHLQGRYVLQVPLALPEEGPGERTQLEAATPSLIGLLRFLGHYGWVGFTVLALLLSALLWWPFVLGITRRVGRLTSVTERISHGRFSERADPGRADELGRLATSVNLMAERLNTQVEAQRHFLLDAAHELTSPLARVQVGLALVQEDLPPAVAERLAGVQADTQQMSTLLQDLLQFSRGERADVQPTLEPVPVDEVFAAVCALEDPAGLTRAPAAPGVAVLAERALLERALANLVRNALRYGAGSAITLSAEVHGTRVHLIVADRGPGVPADALPRLGEAFYRPDVARGRQTGGTGLGLAIVRRCVERLGGTVAFANRQGGGFEVRVELPAAGSAGGASPRE